MKTLGWLLLLVGAVVAIHAPSAMAAGWDLIYTDHLDVTWPDNTVGFSLGTNSFALVVNTSVDPMPLETLWANHFTITSSRSDVILSLGLSDPGSPLGGPVLYGEAMGNVGTPTSVLLSQIRPGETYRSTAPQQFFFFQLWKTAFVGRVEGPATFDVAWEMGGYMARFSIGADMSSGPFGVSFPSAARVTAVPTVTQARSTTWGAIKRLYR